MNPENRTIIEYWKQEPAPLLPILHQFQDRDGFLSEQVIRDTAEGLRIPLAELFGTISFYHHFSMKAGGHQTQRVCTGPVCVHQGSEDFLTTLANGGEMPCAGRCDDPFPVLQGNVGFTVKKSAEGFSRNTPNVLIPAPNPGGYEECIFSNIRKPGQNTLTGYRSNKGFQALESVKKMSRDEVLKLLKESQLAGRGGAGFPVHLKWRAVAEAEGNPKTIVCNADEGEPGCFKDRAILEFDPFAMLEGMLIAAHVTGAQRGFIYLRYEYPETYNLLLKCVAALKDAGFCGTKDSGKFELYVRRGAGAYICGEEGALLNSLEGKHPFPRNRPPFPVTHGFEDLPTVVNNVETLAAVPKIFLNGPEWYRSLGLGNHAGTKVVSVSGDVQQPGNFEIPFGLPLQTLLHDWAGGPYTDRSIQAVTMAGVSGGFLAGTDLDVTLDEPSIRAKGSMFGAGGIMVFDDRRDMRKVTANIMQFYASESCGKCFPCRIGTQRLKERLNGQGMENPAVWQREIEEISHVMKKTSACGLGMAAPLAVESWQRYFN